MSEQPISFEDWWFHTGNPITDLDERGYAEAAWNHQQHRIAELEAKVKELEGLYATSQEKLGEYLMYPHPDQAVKKIEQLEAACAKMMEAMQKVASEAECGCHGAGPFNGHFMACSYEWHEILSKALSLSEPRSEEKGKL